MKENHFNAEEMECLGSTYMVRNCLEVFLFRPFSSEIYKGIFVSLSEKL